MNTKKILFMIFAILALTISGCFPQTGLISERYVGTEGITMNFIPDMPPDDSVYEDSQFKIGIEMQNKGANNATGFLTIGYDKALITPMLTDYTDMDTGQTTQFQDVVQFMLAGRGSKGEGYPGQAARTLINLNSSKITLSEMQNTQVSFNLCYNTETSFKTQVCVDPDIYQEFSRQKVCQNQEQSFGQGQGSPISITKIQTTILPEADKVKPRFKITISNNQNGLIVDESKVEEACKGTSVGRGSYGIIKITPKLEGKDLVCTRTENGKFDLTRTNNNEIECETTELYDKSNPAHLETLEILLDYGYMQSSVKTLNIYKKREIV